MGSSFGAVDYTDFRMIIHAGWRRPGEGPARWTSRTLLRGAHEGVYSQASPPPDWYSMTRVSKKFFSFFRSIISLIHGNGLSVAG